MNANWCVYLLECRGGSLYCGATNDLPRRLKAHASGKGSKHVRSRLPFKLAAIAPCAMTKRQALRFEARVKRLLKSRKKMAVALMDVDFRR